MASKRATNAELEQRSERAADLLSRGTPSQLVVKMLAQEYEVTERQARDYVSQGKTLLVKSVDPEDKTFMICQTMECLKEDRLAAREAGNLSAAVGASKGLIKTTELLIKHQREDEWEKMWDEELDQDTKEAFKEWIKAGMPKAKTGKIPRQRVNDLDRMDKYVHPWDAHCKSQDELPF
tara:strand:- start:353 stop:889 length:537 start_codon:yes stop_codon:yes gene_type:complete